MKMKKFKELLERMSLPKIGDEIWYGKKGAKGIKIVKTKVIEVKGDKISTNSTATLHSSDQVKNKSQITMHHDFAIK